jgi:hypothetical protein
VASTEAVGLLGAIVLTATGVVSLAVGNAAKNVAVNTASSVGESIVEGASSMTGAVVEMGKKVGEVVGIIQSPDEPAGAVQEAV